MFNSFKLLNQRVIKASASGVNKNSDIAINPVFFKTGRRVTHIQFSVENNPQLHLFDSKECSPALTALVKYSVNRIQAEMFIAEYGEEYVLEKIKYIEHQQKANKIDRSLGGYLVDAIKHDWKHKTPKQAKKEKEAAQEKAILEERQEEIKRQQRQQQEEADVEAYFESLETSKQAEILEQFYSEVVEKNTALKHLKSQGKTIETSKILKRQLLNYLNTKK